MSTEDNVRRATPQEVTVRIGHNLLEFLNKPGVSPPLKPTTINDYKAWQECCSFAMSLVSGETVCINGQLAGVLKTMETSDATEQEPNKLKEGVEDDSE
jgi:hypothetical protein